MAPARRAYWTGPLAKSRSVVATPFGKKAEMSTQIFIGDEDSTKGAIRAHKIAGTVGAGGTDANRMPPTIICDEPSQR
jgi:hypothetical protein